VGIALGGLVMRTTRVSVVALASVWLAQAGVVLALAGDGFAQPVQTARKPADPVWLDAPLTNWNETQKSVPAAPKSAAPALADPRCKDQIRHPNSPEDHSVVNAGWTLVGARQTFEDITLVTAMAETDGMCRPLGYQAFVFVGRRFAGTLSPVPMDSRTDGMVDRIFLTTADRVTAEFRRYKENDPLCCPSGGSGVSYRVERKGARPMLVPDQSTPTPK
jgi:hypothetical protein